MYEQKAKRMKFYAVNDVMSMHKYAYYGETIAFKRMAKDNDVIDDFINTIYYCINEGCKRNFSFAEYIHKNFKFLNLDYKKSITATYLKKGIFETNLYIDQYDYGLYGEFPKKSLDKLINHEEIHDILAYVITLNGWSEYVNKIKKKEEYHIEQIVNELKFDNLFNVKEEVLGITPCFFIPIKTNYTLKEQFDVEIFRYNTDKDENYFIENIEQEFLNVYNYAQYEEKYMLEEKELNEYNIYKDVRFAIQAYTKNIFLNECISKFVEVNPIQSIDIVKKHKPFLKLNGTFDDRKVIDEYEKIDKNYKYNILYTYIIYYAFDFKMMHYLDEFIEYSLIEAIIDSCNLVAFVLLERQYNKNKKCYKILDIENSKYLEKGENIDLDFKEIKNKIKFNAKIYKNNCYIID